MKKNINTASATSAEQKRSGKKVLLKGIALALLIFVLASLTIWNSWVNKKPVLNTITVTESNLPADFDGFRIAHISDFHSAKNMTDLVIDQLKDAKPDIICITGDLISSSDKNPDVALDFVKKAMGIAQCYFVAGNHENKASSDVFNALLEGMAEGGAILVENEILQIGESEIAMFGNFYGKAKEEEFMPGYEGYKIMLSHDPADMDYYTAAKYDLVLSGHAHGGLLRLPFVGGIYAPGQGLFPKYDAGVFSEGNTDMIVSRGVGNSGFLPRFNNQPEVVVVELKCN